MVMALEYASDREAYVSDHSFEFSRPSNRPNYSRLRSSRASRSRKRPNSPGGIRQRRNHRWSW